MLRSGDNYLDTHRWYSERRQHLGEEFASELRAVIDRIAAMPRAGTQIDERETRRWLMKRFPFAVVYFQSQVAIEILAVSHQRRRPGYWRRRK